MANEILTLNGEKKEDEDITVGVDELNFDRAQYAQGTAPRFICATCAHHVKESYYMVDGVVCCSECRTRIVAALTGGSSVLLFLRAACYGLAAAAVGSGIYFAVLRLTGYQVGLVAVIVGLMVGKAVSLGSNRRGGWKYQLLAVLLTYSAIVTTYIPLVLDQVRKEQAKKPEVASTASPTGARSVDRPEKTNGERSKSDSMVTMSKRHAGRPSFLMLTAGFGLLFAVAFVIPFLAGLKNIIGLLIIGFAVYEAWKLNKRVLLQISGPYPIGAAVSPGMPPKLP